MGKPAPPKPKSTNWSAQVTQTSNALDLEPGVFTWKDPRRKAPPFRSAMSMLVFYLDP